VNLSWLFNDDVSIETVASVNMERLGIKFGKRNRNSQWKRAPVSLCPPLISHDLTWDWTRAAAVGSRRLTKEPCHCRLSTLNGCLTVTKEYCKWPRSRIPPAFSALGCLTSVQPLRWAGPFAWEVLSKLGNQFWGGTDQRVLFVVYYIIIIIGGAVLSP
jgi:hypothetical protein